MEDEKITVFDRSFLPIFLRLIFILVALLIGPLSRDVILFPTVAYFIRDSVAWLFQSIGFSIIKINSSSGIGLQFNEFGSNGDVVHGLLAAGCLSFTPFLALATDYFVYSIIKFYIEQSGDFQTLLVKAIRTFFLLAFFLPFTFFRFVLILTISLFLWNTPFWEAHFFIGHDLIGNIILYLILLSLYCFLVYPKFSKIQFNKLKNFFQKKA